MHLKIFAFRSDMLPHALLFVIIIFLQPWLLLSSFRNLESVAQGLFQCMMMTKVNKRLGGDGGRGGGDSKTHPTTPDEGLVIKQGEILAKADTRYLFFCTVHLVIHIHNIMRNRSYRKHTTQCTNSTNSIL